MKRFFLTIDELNNKTITSDEFNHMKNVLRMNVGDEFIAFIDDEYNYLCKIENINNLFGLKVYSSNEKPTNGEFIALVADKMLIEGA